MFQTLLRKITTRFLKPILSNYLKSSRVFKFKPFTLVILPGVFHPAFFFSTKYLLNYLKQINLKDKRVVEVGAGNGLISFNLALKAKEVMALEISEVAVKGLIVNFQNNKQFIPKNVLKIIQSDLFTALE